MRRTTMLVTSAISALALLTVTGCSSSSGSGAGRATTTITVESWRTDDIKAWKSTIIPAFEKAHPDVKVEFSPTQSTNYDTTLASKLQGGTAGDVIACRPYDSLRGLAAKGYLAKINTLSGVSSFSTAALSAWQDDSGSDYCLPVASVTAGLYYNADILKQLGLPVPQTVAQFMSDLAAVKASGKYSGLAQGTSSAWDLSSLLLENLGENYWKGEEGRQALIKGTAKVTDPEFVSAISEVAQLQPYLPDHYSSMTVDDARALFTAGKAAFYASGSFELPLLTDLPFTLGFAAPPVANSGDQLYLQDHPDTAFGINAASKHAAAAQEFLSWMATPAFAKIYTNALPGFLSMQTATVPQSNSLAETMSQMRVDAKTSPRLGVDRLSAGSPVFEYEIMRLLQKMLNKPSSESPAQVAAELQAGLARWYKPQQ